MYSLIAIFFNCHFQIFTATVLMFKNETLNNTFTRLYYVRRREAKIPSSL